MVLLSPVERETMIEFHDEDGIATIFTCSPELQKASAAPESALRFYAPELKVNTTYY